MLVKVMSGLAVTREELFDYVRSLTNEQLHMALDGGWNLLQILEHLYLTEKQISRAITYYAVQPEDSEVKEKPIHYLLDRSRKIKAPKATEPTGGEYSKEQLLQQLCLSRDLLQQAIKNLDQSQLINRSFPHVALGDLSLLQWIELIGLHEKRHMLQMEEIIKNQKISGN